MTLVLVPLFAAPPGAGHAFEPVVAWLTSLAILHEGLTARTGCGAALILAAILAAEFIGPAVVP